MPKQGQSSDFNAAMKALAVLILFLISLADICNSVRLSKPHTIIQPECICNKCSEGNISKCLLNLNQNINLGLAWKKLRNPCKTVHNAQIQ